MKQAELFSRLASAPAGGSDLQLALSLMQPWPWSILEAGKRLENRSLKNGNKPPMMNHRGPLWLHASKNEPRQFWEESLEDMLNAGLIRRPVRVDEQPGLPDMPARAAVARGAIVGRCNVIGHVEARRIPATARNGRPRVEMFKYFGIRGEGVKPSHVREVSSPEWLRRQTLWWGRGYALILADVHKLRTPVPCKGSQGLWRVQPDTAAQLEGAELIPCAAQGD